MINTSLRNSRFSYKIVQGRRVFCFGCQIRLRSTHDIGLASIPDRYDPAKVERKWYKFWEDNGYFEPGPKHDSSSDSFTMILPPPNITGSLHCGHALTASIQDALARWHRMNGRSVLYIPGTDHAGIATQTVVEKLLAKKQGVTRHEIGRDKFIEESRGWANRYGTRINEQHRRLGASLSWSHYYFTLDEKRSKFVRDTFLHLYRKGLIYRDTRMINWCCALETTISDIELDYITIDKPQRLHLPNQAKPVEFGVLHKFAYQLEDGTDELVVATTRIETMLGDTAIAIHSSDERYKKFHGKKVLHPLNKRLIPIICDSNGFVDPDFGTGAVKITPAHDYNDYLFAKRYGLPFINIWERDGTVSKDAGIFEGLDRFAARDAVIDQLKLKSLYRGKEAHNMRLALCSRSGDVIEPMIQPQWFINVKAMAEAVNCQVKNGEIRITPESYEQELFRWLENIQDWCISRQLWWGHRIPAYQLEIENQDTTWIAAESDCEAEREARKIIADKGLPPDTPFSVSQDPDVLDTWFSSALLPLAATNPDSHAFQATGLKNYPTTLLETGNDILFFWVARMAMLCNELSGLPPFKDVLLHGMVRDSQGRKMSKSLGNVIDPIDVIEGKSLEELKSGLTSGNLPPQELKRSLKNLERQYPEGIPKCGADALRFTLLEMSKSRLLNLDISRITHNLHFCNKLYNLYKFVSSQLRSHNHKFNTSNSLTPQNFKPSSPVCRYILSRLSGTISICEQGFADYNLAGVADAVSKFAVSDFADIFVEFAKVGLRNPTNSGDKVELLDTLGLGMDALLKLLHPLMPFITEELYQDMRTLYLAEPGTESIMISDYPTSTKMEHFWDPSFESNFRKLIDVIHATRSLRQDQRIPAGEKLPLTISYGEAQNIAMALESLLHGYRSELRHFTRSSDIVFTSIIPPKSVTRVISPELKIHLPINEIGQNPEQLSTLQKRLGKLDKDIEKLKNKRFRPEYESKVPLEVQEVDRKKLEAFMSRRTELALQVEIMNSKQ
ncbi:valine--tRNA ligase-like protein [Paraphysoderma sedebokerense]|nr:valine--tRNA ligase-like protein [Paraphysoderma sedebokerense]